jgi:hypothetical protein
MVIGAAGAAGAADVTGAVAAEVGAGVEEQAVTRRVLARTAINRNMNGTISTFFISIPPFPYFDK